jgi:hypothetical protein
MSRVPYGFAPMILKFFINVVLLKLPARTTARAPA